MKTNIESLLDKLVDYVKIAKSTKSKKEFSEIIKEFELDLNRKLGTHNEETIEEKPVSNIESWRNICK